MTLKLKTLTRANRIMKRMWEREVPSNAPLVSML